MRLAFFADGIVPFQIGGMQKHSLHLVRHLAQLGVEVDLYCALPEASGASSLFAEHLAVCELEHVTFHPIPRPTTCYYPGHYVRRSYLTSESLLNAFRQGPRADFIYAQGFAGWAAVRARQKHPTTLPPVGINLHGVEMYQKSASPRARVEQWMFRPFAAMNLRNADVALSLGGGLSRIIEGLGVPPERIVESPNGVGEDWLVPEVPARKGLLTFAFVGRYERRKGIQELHNAIRQLEAAHDFRFNVIGPIPEALRLPSPRVTYHGLVREEDRVKALLRASDVLVCPSYSEGMPTVILEAMASGLAVIATDVGAVDALVSEANGWLIPPGDPQALRQAMRAALTVSDAELHRKKQEGRRIVAEHYLWDTVAKKTIEGIERFLSDTLRHPERT